MSGDSKISVPFAGKSVQVTVPPFASGKVTGATGALTDGVNVTSSTRTGAGVYDIVLSSSLADTNRHVSLTVRGGAGVAVETGAPTGTTFTVSTFDMAGNPADIDFTLAVLQTVR